MSGGSYNYLCYSHDLDDLIAKRHSLEEMAEKLESMDEKEFPGVTAAAKQTRGLLIRLRMWETHAEATADILRDVWKAVEWTDDCDWGPDSIVEALDKLVGDPS